MKINKSLIPFYLIIAIAYFALSHFNFEFYTTGNASDYSIYVLILLFISSYLFFINSRVTIRRDSLYKIIILFTALSFLTQVPIIMRSNTNAVIRNILHTFAVPLGYMLGFSLYNSVITRASKSSVYLLFLLLPIFYTAFRYLSIPWVDPDCLFFIILLFPLVFCLKKDLTKTVLFVLMGVICAFSAKRSILIAYSISLSLFILHHTFLNNRKGKSFKSVFIVLIIFIVAYSFINNNNSAIDNILSRFQGIKEDNGSGRTELYSILLDSFRSSPFVSQLFGHGYRSSIDALDGIPAHNDFLQILYDFGVVSLFVYIILLLQFVKVCFYSLKQRSFSNSTIMLSVSVCNLIVLGSLNNIYNDTLFIFTAFLCLGTSLSMVKSNNYR